MTSVWSDPLQFLTACATLLAILWGLRKTIADIAQTRAATRQTSNNVDRDVREEDREQATRDLEANAALVASITAGWNVIAEQQSRTIASLEQRVQALEQSLEDREQVHARELEARENKIREYRDKLHAANNELARHGLMKHLVEAGVFPAVDDDGIAPERRTASPVVAVVPVQHPPEPQECEETTSE